MDLLSNWKAIMLNIIIMLYHKWIEVKKDLKASFSTKSMTYVP